MEVLGLWQSLERLLAPVIEGDVAWAYAPQSRRGGQGRVIGRNSWLNRSPSGISAMCGELPFQAKALAGN